MIDGMLKLGIGFGALIVSPVLNLITLQIPNAAVLLFPAWFLPGKGSVQGIEATGQRLIFVFGQFLVFALALVPATLGFLAVFFLVKMLAGLTLAVPLASVAAAVVLAAEVSLGVVLLGWLFQRYDVAAEQTA